MLRFFALTRDEKLAVSEAILCLCFARLTLVVPFGWVARRLGRIDRLPDGSETPLSDDQRAAATSVRRALLRAQRGLPWHTSCLVGAIAGRLMLNRRRLPSNLHLGARNESRGEMAAHAWLRCGEIGIFGTETADQYTPIVAFKA